MKNATEIIIHNIDDPEFSVDNLAVGLHMSRTQLYRKSEKLLGMSANNFIKKVKLNHAWELLEDGEYNISEVAYRVGFKTPGYFSKCFEEQFGVLPSRHLASKTED
jgi:AraC-like DNA-binding protein